MTLIRMIISSIIQAVDELLKDFLGNAVYAIKWLVDSRGTGSTKFNSPIGIWKTIREKNILKLSQYCVI